MTYKRFHDKIVKMLPSKDLKAAVKAQGFTFTEKDLLKLIDMYAPTLDDRLKLFGEAAEAFTQKENIAHAKKLIAFNKNVCDKFTAPGDDAVFEVDIKCAPLDNEETYIVRTFEDALTTIRAFLKYYRDCGAVDNELARYTVTKKTVGAPKTPRDIQRLGEIGECTLGKGLKIVSLYVIGMYGEFVCRGRGCADCKHPCIDAHEIDYPVFLEKDELVAYRSGRYRRTDDGYTDVEYGINMTDMTEYNSGSPCIVLLDNEYIQERRADEKDEDGYYPVYGPHEHPEFAGVFKPDMSELPKELLDDYAYAVETFKKIDGND